MYQRKSSMSTRQQYGLIEHFVAGTTARAASQIIGVQATTVARCYMRLRKLIASKLPSYELYGQVEVDESYFGGRRKAMRGRGATGKIAVFGLLKRGGKVYTAIIPNAKTPDLTSNY
jgi:transposase